VVFEADYDEIKLQKHSFHVTDHHYVTKKRYQNYVTKILQIGAPLNQNFWLRQ